MKGLHKGKMDSQNLYYRKCTFFLRRFLPYIFFLFLVKSAGFFEAKGIVFQLPYISFFIFFIGEQWFTFGKEWDSRGKIYYKVHSSLDRIVYRLFVGQILSFAYFMLIGQLNSELYPSVYYISWALFGGYRAWPTQGKIKVESLSSELRGLKYLDKLELTILFATLLLFFFSIPKDALIYQGSIRNLQAPYETYLNYLYFPMKAFPRIQEMLFHLHFYFLGIGVYILTSYALFRYFVSRRSALIGIFSIISSYSFSKWGHLGVIWENIFPIVWLWIPLWVQYSSNYRGAYLYGVIGGLSVLFNPNYLALSLLHTLLGYFLIGKEKSTWFKRQFYKYLILGQVFVFIFWYISRNYFIHEVHHAQFFDFINIRKAFFVLSPIGLSMLAVSYFREPLRSYQFHRNHFQIFGISLILLLLASGLFDANFGGPFIQLWLISFFSLIPIEHVFQNATRLRSKRNLIFVLYFIVCLLDSHLDGRVKSLLHIF